MTAELQHSSAKIKGLILGGGRGTRLNPLTEKVNKHLLPVGSKPLIMYAINQLVEANIRDILLLIDHLHADQFMKYLKDGSHLGIDRLAYIWQSPEGKGLSAAIGQAEPFIQDEKLVVVCGDVIIENGIQQAVADFVDQSEGARIVATSMNDTAGYSLLDLTPTHVKKILSKDNNRHQSGYIDLGIYMYHADVFEEIRKLKPSERGEIEVWDLNEIYVKRGMLEYTAVQGWWSDVGGSLENYLEAHSRYDK